MVRSGHIGSLPCRGPRAGALLLLTHYCRCPHLPPQQQAPPQAQAGAAAGGSSATSGAARRQQQAGAPLNRSSAARSSSFTKVLKTNTTSINTTHGTHIDVDNGPDADAGSVSAVLAAEALTAAPSSRCAAPATHVFFDGVHPTSRAHLLGIARGFAEWGGWQR